MIDAVEDRRCAGRRVRPAYVRSGIEGPEASALVRRRPDLRRRIFGVDAVSSTPAMGKFVLRYNAIFSPKIAPASATSAPYDAFYLLAYAAAALGDEPLTGVALARAIPRLLPPGQPVEVGPAGISTALAALAAGRGIDLQGTVTTLDFDLESGDASADFALYCLGPASGEIVEVIESGLVFDARTTRLRGALRCP